MMQFEELEDLMRDVEEIRVEDPRVYYTCKGEIGKGGYGTVCKAI